MYIQLFDHNMDILRTISSVVREGVGGVAVIPIPGKYKLVWVHNWDGYVIINDQTSEMWFWNHKRTIGSP